MKPQKTWIDHVFDCLLIFAPLVYLLHVDVYAKAMIVFYVFYLPYLIYVINKEVTASRIKHVKKITKQTIKKKEIVVLSN